MVGLIVGIVSWIWGGLQTIATWVVYALQAFVTVLARFVSAIWDVAKFTWSNVLKPVGEWLDRAYQRLRTFYEDIYARVHGWLARISGALRAVYNTYFRPVLNAIDSVRRALGLLALLHVQWAAKLDAELADLERKITAPLLTAIQVVNAIDSRIADYILTVDNLFQRVTLLKSVARDLGQITNMQWGAMLRNVPSGAAGQKPPHSSLVPPEAHAAAFKAIIDGDADATDTTVAENAAFLATILAA